MPDEKKKYVIHGSDFRFHKITYPEGSTIELSDSELKAESCKGIAFIPVEKKGGK